MEYQNVGVDLRVRASEATVIAVETMVGEGTQESLVRNVLTLFTKSGKLICTIDPVEIDNSVGKCTCYNELFGN